MRIKHFIALAAVVIAASACSEMDPFTGEEGIRFNMNGRKYVMQSGLFGISPLWEKEDGVTIYTSLSGPSALDMCSFRLNLCNLDQLAVDKEYNTGENGITAEISPLSVSFSDIASTVKESADQETEVQENTEETVAKPVPLQGWVKRVASENAKLELLFEFSGKDEAGNEYVIKHGFLRL